MFVFLSRLFSGLTPDSGDPNDAIVDAAIERVLDGTDPRLRGFMNYRARLHDAAACAVRHVVQLVDSLPEPAEISASAYSGDPRLKVFFASPGQMREIFEDAQTLRDVIDTPGAVGSSIYALLSMSMDERQVLGLELRGDDIRRDVLQDVVSFSEHRFVCASVSAADTAKQLKVRAFDFLVEQALQGLLEAQKQRAGLEHQRQLLQRKLDAMKAGEWGLATVLGGKSSSTPDRLALEKQIAAIESELTERAARPDDLESHFDTINGVLKDADRWLGLRTTEIHVDAMLVKREPGTGRAVQSIPLIEIHSANGQHRIIHLSLIPKGEIPPPKDGLDEAMRVLGQTAR